MAGLRPAAAIERLLRPRSVAATSERKFPAILGAIRELESTKLIVFAGLDEGAAVPQPYVRELRGLGVAYFPSPDCAIRAVARVAGALSRRPLHSPPPLALAAASLLTGVVPEYRVKAFLGPLGFPFPSGRLVKTLEEALAAASQLGYPVALKAQSAELSHKSDAGGVVLALCDRDALAAGWERLHASLARHRPGAGSRWRVAREDGPSRSRADRRRTQ